MYDTFDQCMDFDTQARQAALVKFSVDFVNAHPYFELVEVRDYSETQDQRTFYKLSCYDDSESVTPGVAVFFKKTRPDDGEIYAFMFWLHARDCGIANRGAMVKMDKSNQMLEDVWRLNYLYTGVPQYDIIKHAFSTYDPVLLVSRSSRNFRETKSNYSKSLEKAFDRFGHPVRREPKFNLPEFYPEGSLVSFKDSITQEPARVSYIVTNGPNSYLLYLAVMRESSYTSAQQVAINTSHVASVKRGTGRVFKYDPLLEELADKKHRAGEMYFGSLPTVKARRQYQTAPSAFIGCSTPKFWTVTNAHQFVTAYINAFVQVSFDFNDQFDLDRFVREVRFDEGWYTTKIDRKKFRRALKRLHTFLDKKKVAVEQSEIEDLRYSEDMDF